jgi:orotate phosphoribosyltransferase
MNDLARQIHERSYLTGEFTLRSGLTATHYFDKYLFESDPALLREVVDAMVPFVPAGTELLGGLELGGIPLATLLGQVTGLPVLFVRKEAKAYGTRKLVEGANCAGRNVTLVEDVISTGGAVINAAHALRALNATADTVVCAIDRRAPDANQLASNGIQVRAVLTGDQLANLHR